MRKWVLILPALGTIAILAKYLPLIASYNDTHTTYVTPATYIFPTTDPCSPDLVEKWFDGTNAILKDFKYEVAIARQSIVEQKALNNPPCLDLLQLIHVEFYTYNMYALEYYSNGNYDEAKFYADKSEETYQKIQAESDRLAALYGWK